MSGAAGGSGPHEPPREPTLRLFFALWPEAELRAAFAHATRHAVRACGGRPVPAASLHVTLAFLGSVPQGRMPALVSIARQVAVRSRPVALTFDRLERWAKPQVLAATSSVSSPHVAALAEALCQQAAAGGFSPDLKPFRAHVTVARKVVRRADSPAMDPIPWAAAGFALVSSITAAQGPAYSVIESFTLDGAQGGA